MYASAAKGFRPGGGNGPALEAPGCGSLYTNYGLNSIPSSYKSDSLWTYELGTKDSFFDRRLSVETDIYYTRWSEIQTSLALYGCDNSFIANAGLAVSQGADLQITALLTEGWKLSLLAGYDNAYDVNTVYVGSAQAIIGGDKLSGVHPWTSAVNSEYSHDISALWANSRAYLRADFRYLDGTPSCDPASPYCQPLPNTNRDQAYSLLNLRVGVKHETWDLSLYANNVTNSNPMLGWGNIAGGTPNLLQHAPLAPRTVGVDSWFRF